MPGYEGGNEGGREGERDWMEGKNDPDPNPTIYARLRMTSSDVGNITASARQVHPTLTTAAMRGMRPDVSCSYIAYNFL